MANIITTGSFPKGLIPGVKASFGNKYNQLPKEYAQIFKTVTSDRNYEEYVGISPFGMANVKSEGSGISYDTSRQGFITRLVNTTYANGFIITMEQMEDNNYLPEGPKKAESLANSFVQTEEYTAGNVLTRAFATYLGGDGVALCVTNHPNIAGGTYSNALATPADLAESQIEQLITQIMTATDDRGNRILLKPKGLIVSPSDSFEANRIVKSQLQNDTANNAINVINSNNLLPDGVIVNRYYSAGNGAWFINTDAPEGLMFQQRTPVKFGQANDNDTLNLKFYGYTRFAVGWGDPRGLYGSAGAA